METAFHSFEQAVQQFTLILATGVEGASGLIVAVAVIEAALRAFSLFFIHRHLPEQEKEALRLRLGRWLAVVLEFLLAADILRTAVAPTWSDIGKLAAIAAIRTALNYFLSREVRDAGHPEGNGGTEDGAAAGTGRAAAARAGAKEAAS